MAEGMMASLLSASNRARRFAKGMMQDPATTIADYLAALDAEHKEANEQRAKDTGTMLYRGVMKDDPSYLAARDAAERRAMEEAMNWAGGGVGATRKAAVGVKNSATKTSGDALRSGTLAAAKAEGAPMTVDRLMDSPAAVAARREHIRARLQEPFTPWRADDAGSYFDRALIPQAMSGHPGVTQSPLARLSPTPKANLAPAQNINTPENMDLVRMQVARGQQLGGETYYPSTFPIRARYGELNGPITFDDFVNANAATSPQAPLQLNIPNATLMLYMKKHGIPPTFENAQKLIEHLKQSGSQGFFFGPSHMDNWVKADTRGLMGFDKDQKIASYGQNLRGNFAPYALDTHESKGLSQGTAYFPYFDKQKGMKNTEYGTVEKAASGLASSLGMAPANMQANRWFGGGFLTGLRSPQGDYLSTLEDLIRWNAEVRGWSPSRPSMQKKINEVLQGDEILLPYWRRTPSIEYNRGLFD